MSGTGRDAGGLNAGTSGSSSMGDRGLGSAEVHTGLHSGSGDQYSGLQFAGHEDQSGGGRLRGVADAVRERIPDRARDLGSRASEATAGVRERLGNVRERANGMMESRGMLDRLRENPLPVLGVAFALGFLLSGGDEDDEYGEQSRASSARSELRSALMAGVTAGIAQGARGFLGQASSEGGSFLNTLLDSLTGEGGGSRGESTGARAGSGSSSAGASSGMGRSGSTGGGSSTARSSTGTRRPSHQEY